MNSLRWPGVYLCGGLSFAGANYWGRGRMESVGAQGHFTREPETGFQRGMPGFLLRWRGEEFEVVSPKGSGLGDTKSAAAADLEGDGDVDLVVGQNNDRLLTLENK